MKKSSFILLMCMVWFCCTAIQAQNIPNNEIWYEANKKLVESKDFKPDAFNVQIISHTFNKKRGIIKFNGPVIVIGECAFERNNKIKHIYLPNSVDSIKMLAFSKCEKLTSIALPDSMSFIGPLAFANSGLVGFVIPDSLTCISEAVFFECEDLRIIAGFRNVKKISTCAFAGCESIRLITLPKCLEIIEDEAFNGCSKLEYIFIPESVTFIGKGAFNDCKNLEFAYMPSNLNIKNVFTGSTYAKIQRRGASSSSSSSSSSSKRSSGSSSNNLCSRCSGSGYLMGLPCPFCSGTGRIVWNVNPNSVTPSGGGNVTLSNPTSGGASGGSSGGYSTPKQNSGRSCPECHGTGNCQICNGSGIDYGYPSNGTKSCAVCHGRKKCTRCNGTGKVN